jgi:tRNA (guanine-N7-)-methyltransferase
MKARYLSLTPFICWRQAERPINWQHHFGRIAPLEVEIGFGNGEFLVQQAQAHPECNFVGLELEWASVQRGLRKIAQAGVSNVRLLQVDARVAMERLFRPQSLVRAYALFPCPWPKDRHIKHRLFSQTFLKLLNSRLIPRGEVQIVTDYEPYVQWMLGQVPGTGFDMHWRRVAPRFSTKYERKWYAQGQEQFYEVRLRQQEYLPIPLQEDVTLQIHRIKSFDPDHFQPTGARGDIAIAFKDFLFDPKRQRGLVRVYVSEENLKQDFWIEIARGDGSWYIRPARGCALVPTVGVQYALDLVYDATRQ